MDDPTDRTDRFECIAVADGDDLATLADRVLATDPELSIRQAPRPQLLAHRVTDPVERRPFTLGEVVVTPAEVSLDDARGFAMIPGKAERAALAGAIVDAAVAGGHPVGDDAIDSLAAAAAAERDRRRQAWAETRHTTVEFDTMEDQQ